jgi:hypothetical protein
MNGLANSTNDSHLIMIDNDFKLANHPRMAQQ